MPEYDKYLEGTDKGLAKRTDGATVTFVSAEKPAVIKTEKRRDYQDLPTDRCIYKSDRTG